MFHSYEGREHSSDGPYPPFCFRHHIIQRGATALCTALKPAKSKEFSLLFHLCVAVTDKGRQFDDNEEARYHQTVITMVTTALCGCQSTALIIP